MSSKFSSEQTAHYVAFIALITELFKINITESEIETLIKGIFGVGALVFAFYKRYQRGDLHLSGMKKRGFEV